MRVDNETFELAKELGFDDCECVCSKGILNCECFNIPPKQYFLQNWLRNKCDHRIFVTQKVAGDFGFEIYIPNEPSERAGAPFVRVSPFTKHYPTYEAALEIGLIETLKLIENE